MKRDQVLDQVSPAWNHKQNRDNNPAGVTPKTGPQAGRNQGKMKLPHGPSNIGGGIH